MIVHFLYLYFSNGDDFFRMVCFLYLHWRHYLHLLGHDDDHSQIFDETVMIWYSVVLVVDDSKYSFGVGVIPVGGIVWIRRWTCQGGTGRRGHLVSRPTLFVWCVF